MYKVQTPCYSLRDLSQLLLHMWPQLSDTAHAITSACSDVLPPFSIDELEEEEERSKNVASMSEEGTRAVIST